MADLSGGVGQARAQNGRTAARNNLSAPSPRTPQVRSPREIMRDRERREALRKLEQEQQNRPRTGRPSDQTAGVGESGDGGIAGTENRRSTARQQYETLAQLEGGGPKDKRSADAAAARTGGQARVQDSGTRSASQPVPQQPTRTSRTSGAQNNQPSQPQQQSTRTASGPAGTARAQPDPSRPQVPNNKSKNNTAAFPHAFERWETLSSHWEGLTSFWINRLQENSDELNGQPINQQLARQVTDLSAAGANLFHAVVELQRLRASSERKFQRWFFETRAEQQETTERIAQLESELAAARQGVPAQPTVLPQPSPEEIRKQAERLATDEIEKVKRQCALEIKEKNRELEISREEARRGWEEIGRMEQDNRERTISLRRGEPTTLGGVQVVPLPTNTSGAIGGQSGGLSSHPPTREDPAYAGYDMTRSETDTDPFTESGRDTTQTMPQAVTASPRLPPSSSAAMQAAQKRTATASPVRPQTAGQPFASSSVYATEPTTSANSGGFCQHSGAGTSLHAQTRRDNRPYMTSEPSEEGYDVDEHGQIHHEQLEPPVRPRTDPSEISDEYDVLERMEREQFLPRGYPSDYSQAQGYATSNGGSYQAATDYSAPGYADQNWQPAIPRHQHPSRLSDVLEEDERSRTSETSRRYHN